MNGDTICLVVGVRGGRLGRARDSRASLTPAVPLHRAHDFQSGDNLAHRVGVRAIVKPYVFGCLEKSWGHRPNSWVFPPIKNSTELETPQNWPLYWLVATLQRCN